MAATPPPRGSRAYDGRLDPDDLDRALDLDVLADGPDDDAGRARRPERASRPLLAATVVAAVVVGAAALVAIIRPEPPPPLPPVSVAAGGEADVRPEVDRDTGQVRSLGRLVVVSSASRPEVEVRTVGVRGPGLAEAYARVPVVTSGSARTGPVGAAVECTSDPALDSVLSASPTDYHVTVRRSTPDGTSDETDVALPGADEWLAAVREACVRDAAGRGLRVEDATVAAVPGAAAVDLVLTVRNDSARDWLDLRLASGGGRAVSPTDEPVDLAPGGSAPVRAVVWARDCTAALAGVGGAVLAEASVTRTDGAGFAPLTRFPLELDDVARAALGAAVTEQCAGTTPELRVVRTKIREGAQDDSAGTLDIAVDVRVPAAAVSVGPVVDGSGQGRIRADRASWPVVDGTATVTLRWELPSCLSLLTRGAVELPVRVQDPDGDRRYLVELRGELLRVELSRLCGPTVAAIAR